MRTLHIIAIAFQLCAIALFVWQGMYFFAGWAAFFGAYSSWQIKVLKGKPRG